MLELGKEKSIDGYKCQNIRATFHDAPLCEQFLEKYSTQKKSASGTRTNQAGVRSPVMDIVIYRQIPRELKKLKWLADKKKESLKFKFCWVTKNGKLLMKRQEDSETTWIQTEEDLEKPK